MPIPRALSISAVSGLAACAALALVSAWACPPARAQGPWPSIDTPPAKVGGGERDVALVVSIEDYAKLPDVAGAEANARAWVRWFEVTRAMRSDSIVWLRDNEATPEELLAKAEELAALADPKGMIWVIFIGHGAPAEDQSEGLLVGWAAQQTARQLYAQSLRQSALLAALGGGRKAPITLVIDACFNGTARDGVAVASGLQPALLADRRPSLPAQVTVLSAGRTDQFAGPLPGDARPAFSYLLLGAMRGWADDQERGYGDGDQQVTVAEALDFTRAALRTTLTGRSQTPEVVGSSAAVLARKAKERTPDLGAIRDALRPTPTGGLDLDIEALQADERKAALAREMRSEWAKLKQAVTLSVLDLAAKKAHVGRFLELYAALAAEPELRAANAVKQSLDKGEAYPLGGEPVALSRDVSMPANDPTPSAKTSTLSSPSSGSSDGSLVVGPALSVTGSPEAYEEAGQHFERIAKSYAGKNKELEVQATAAAGLAYKKAAKVKHRKKAERLLRAAMRGWKTMLGTSERGGVEPDAQTKNFAALATFEVAEYLYDDYVLRTIEVLNHKGAFDLGILKRTLVAKAVGLQETEKAFDEVLYFRDPGISAAAAFRLGQILFEFAEALFSSPSPPGLNEDEIDEYRFALEEVAAPVQERALIALDLAIKQGAKFRLNDMWSQVPAARDLQRAVRHFEYFRDHGQLDPSILDPNRTEFDTMVLVVLRGQSTQGK